MTDTTPVVAGLLDELAAALDACRPYADPGLADQLADSITTCRNRLQETNVDPQQIPGWEGSVGPFRAQYNQPHVYARDIHSGAGNCVCGGGLEDKLHVQAAPGVPIPDRMRPLTTEPVAGRVIIEWPPGKPPVAMLTRILDADTGKLMLGVTQMQLLTDCNAHDGAMYARLTELSDADGEPGQPVQWNDDGEVYTVTRTWLVAEHRLNAGPRPSGAPQVVLYGDSDRP